MEVMTIESSAFKELTEQVAMIAEHIRKSSECQKEEISDDRLVSTKEAARILQVSVRTMQRLRDDNRIKFMKVRGLCRYRMEDLKRYITENITEYSSDATTIKKGG